VKRNLAVILVVVGAIAIMIVAARKLRNYPHYTRLPVADVQGKVAPDFTLTSLDGKSVKLSDLKGKAVVLNFWATWCSPCKIEIPWFVDLQNEYGPQGLQIIGVAVDESDKDDVKKFADQMKINYTVAMGDDSITESYGNIQGLPTTFYIGRDGKMVARVPGLVSHREIEDNIKKALTQTATANAATTQSRRDN
jgi:peroxiredoxin